MGDVLPVASDQHDALNAGVSHLLEHGARLLFDGVGDLERAQVNLSLCQVYAAAWVGLVGRSQALQPV